MRFKIFVCVLSLILSLFVLSCCNNENDDKKADPCTHSFADGKCSLCGESDPNYKPVLDKENGDNNNDNDVNDQKPGGDNIEIPDVDLDTETNMPFVPAA